MSISQRMPLDGDVVDVTAVDHEGRPMAVAPKLERDATWPAGHVGPKYPPHDSEAPIFEGMDIAGVIAGAVITLGPLAGVAIGF